MTRASARLVAACVWGVMAIGGPAPALVRADDSPTVVRSSETTTSGRHPARRPDRSGPRSGAGGLSGAWWLGTAGIAVVLAALGGVSMAARRGRLGPSRSPGPLQVVGRTALSPRHAVYLLRAGERVLIVGAGSQGPPALLGELTDPAEVRRLVAPRDERESPLSDSRFGGAR